jgi:glycerol-3-phosphate dehydrogenase
MPNADGLTASQVSREHRIISRPGLLTIVGGKLTTYRRMAAQVVEGAFELLDRRAPACPTGERPLPGAVGLIERAAGVEPMDSVRLALQAIAHPAIDEQVARHLAQQYGQRALALSHHLQNGAGSDGGTERLHPELPYLLAEVDVAVNEEGALRLADVLSRRLPLLLRARDQGLGCADRVARRMRGLLGWSDAQTAAELEDYRDAVSLSRQFRQAPP